MSAAPLRAALRHLFAWATTTAAWLILWTVIYIVLLLWAAIADEGIGSPATYPLGLLGIFVLHSGAALVIFFPITLLAEFICRRKKLPKVRGGIPITFGLFLLFSAIIGYLLSISPGPDTPGFLEAALGLVLLLAIPMGLYWWASQFPSLLRIAFEKVRHKIRS